MYLEQWQLPFLWLRCTFHTDVVAVLSYAERALDVYEK